MNSKILIIAALLSLMIILPTIPNDDRIYAHPAVTDTDIASELNMNMGNVDTALYKLAKKGLITFNPADEPPRYLPS